MAVEYLTHEEVISETGAKTKAGQIMMLKKNGIAHSIKLNGWPSVTAEAVLRRNRRVEEDQPAWTPRKAG